MCIKYLHTHVHEPQAGKPHARNLSKSVLWNIEKTATQPLVLPMARWTLKKKVNGQKEKIEKRKIFFRVETIPDILRKNISPFLIL